MTSSPTSISTPRCPACDEPVRAGAVRCRYCGGDLAIGPVANGQGTDQPVFGETISFSAAPEPPPPPPYPPRRPQMLGIGPAAMRAAERERAAEQATDDTADQPWTAAPTDESDVGPESDPAAPGVDGAATVDGLRLADMDAEFQRLSKKISRQPEAEPSYEPWPVTEPSRETAGFRHRRRRLSAAPVALALGLGIVVVAAIFLRPDSDSSPDHSPPAQTSIRPATGPAQAPASPPASATPGLPGPAGTGVAALSTEGGTAPNNAPAVRPSAGALPGVGAAPPPPSQPASEPATARPRANTADEHGLSSAASVKWVQGVLTNLGYRPGSIDGVLGARTQAAIRDFQRRAGLPPTGRVDRTLVRALGKSHAATRQQRHRPAVAGR